MAHLPRRSRDRARWWMVSISALLIRPTLAASAVEGSSSWTEHDNRLVPRDNLAGVVDCGPAPQSLGSYEIDTTNGRSGDFTKQCQSVLPRTCTSASEWPQWEPPEDEAERQKLEGVLQTELGLYCLGYCKCTNGEEERIREEIREQLEAQVHEYLREAMGLAEQREDEQGALDLSCPEQLDPEDGSTSGGASLSSSTMTQWCTKVDGVGGWCWQGVPIFVPTNMSTDWTTDMLNPVTRGCSRCGCLATVADGSGGQHNMTSGQASNLTGLISGLASIPNLTTTGGIASFDQLSHIPAGPKDNNAAAAVDPVSAPAGHGQEQQQGQCPANPPPAPGPRRGKCLCRDQKKGTYCRCRRPWSDRQRQRQRQQQQPASSWSSQLAGVSLGGAGSCP